MSVEHGSHHGESFSDIIAILLLSFLGIFAITTPIEDTVQEIVIGGGSGGHH